MPLVGGETAEMPDVYRPGEYDLAGTIVGVVAEAEALHGERVRAGRRAGGVRVERLPHQRLLAAPARGVRRPRRSGSTTAGPDPAGRSVADVLLAVHRSYLAAVWPARPRLHALAHITGGGIPGNLVRVLPADVDAVVRPGTWPMPAAFALVQAGGLRERGGDAQRLQSRAGAGRGVRGRRRGCGAGQAARDAGVETWEVAAVVPGSGAVRWEPER